MARWTGLPKSSKRAFALTPAYIEEIHDVMLSEIWPMAEPVQAREYRDRRMLDSATARPFQSALGEEVHPSIHEKAAALFHSLIANHPFINGNKRTASIALDHFLLANGFFLALSEQELYRLATETATYRQRGTTHSQVLVRIAEKIRESSVRLRILKKEANPGWYKMVLRARQAIRRHRLNRPARD